MKLAVIGAIVMLSVAMMVSGNYYKMPMTYGYMPAVQSGGGRSSGFGGSGSSGFGGLFEMIIFLFVFIIFIQILFGSGGIGGGLGGGGRGGGGGGMLGGVSGYHKGGGAHY